MINSESTVAAYDPIAEGYRDFVNASWIHRVSVPALARVCSEVSGRVMDLACGEGVTARAMVRSDREVVGVDLSARLLALARAQEDSAPLGIDYVQDDAVRLAAFAPASIDAVVSNCALSDLADLEGVWAAVGRVLKPGGWLGLSMIHPCFETPGAYNLELEDRVAKVVGRYFQEGARSRSPGSLLANVAFHHRRLATVLGSLLKAGFVLSAIEEPYPPPSVVEAAPHYAQVAEVLVLLFRSDGERV